MRRGRPSRSRQLPRQQIVSVKRLRCRRPAACSPCWARPCWASRGAYLFARRSRIQFAPQARRRGQSPSHTPMLWLVLAARVPAGEWLASITLRLHLRPHSRSHAVGTDAALSTYCLAAATAALRAHLYAFALCPGLEAPPRLRLLGSERDARLWCTGPFLIRRPAATSAAKPAIGLNPPIVAHCGEFAEQDHEQKRR